MKNYYQVLGLEDDASLEDIKIAYKKNVLRYHPDKHDGDEFFVKRFQEIQEAYQYLINNYNAKKNRNQSESNQFAPIQIVTFMTDKDYRFNDENFTITWNVKNADAISIIIKTISEEKKYTNLTDEGTILFSLVESGNIRILLFASRNENLLKKQIIIKERFHENNWNVSFQYKPILFFFIMILILFALFIQIFIR